MPWVLSLQKLITASQWSSHAVQVKSFSALREPGSTDGEILIEGRAGGFQTALAVDLVQPGGGVQAAGTVADDHVGAPFPQQIRQGLQQSRVRGGGGLRRGGVDQIGLDADSHPGPYPVQGSAHCFQRLPAVLRGIVGTGRKAYHKITF